MFGLIVSMVIISMVIGFTAGYNLRAELTEQESEDS